MRLQITHKLDSTLSGLEIIELLVRTSSHFLMVVYVGGTVGFFVSPPCK